MSQLNSYVQRTLESGVAPIQVKFAPVWNLYGDEIVGYYQRGTVNSILFGSLSQESFSAVSDEMQAELFFVLLTKGAKMAQILLDQGKSFNFIAMDCPLCVLERPDFINRVDAIVERQSKLAKTLCFVFPQELLFATEKYTKLIASTRAIGLKVAVEGFGTKLFPMTALASLTPDILFAPELTSYLQKTDGLSVLNALLTFANGLGCQVVASQVQNDADLQKLRSTSCVGVVPSQDFVGSLPSTDEQTPAQVLGIQEV